MINNFVNFITDTITPPVIYQYAGATLGSPDFTGSDASTAEYTKLGWIYKCYGDMVAASLSDASVDSFVTSMQGLSKNGPDILRSPSGFNILQIVVFSRRSNKTFTFADGMPAVDMSKIKPLMFVADNPGGQTAMHMAVDYGMKELVVELGTDNLGHITAPGRTGDFLSPWALSMVRAGEEIVSNSPTTNRRELAQLLSDAAAGKNYDAMYGANPKNAGATGELDNEISKIISSTSHDVLEKAIDYILSPLSTSNVVLTAGAVETTGGISSSSVTFNAAQYSANIESSGYHPLYFYLYKYRASSKLTILDKLSEKFSPVSVSVSESGETEGFTAVGMAAYYLTVNSGGVWNNPALAGWVKGILAQCGGTTDAIWATSGNVRDFTNGSSNNSFGAITNILEKINKEHSSWWADNDDGNNTINDFADTYTTMAGSVLPGSFNYDFYRIWMVEFGKELA